MDPIPKLHADPGEAMPYLDATYEPVRVGQFLKKGSSKCDRSGTQDAIRELHHSRISCYLRHAATSHRVTNASSGSRQTFAANLFQQSEDFVLSEDTGDKTVTLLLHHVMPAQDSLPKFSLFSNCSPGRCSDTFAGLVSVFCHCR